MTRGTSLRTKVPLYIGAGLFVLITGLTWLSYKSVLSASLDAGVSHLEGASREYAEAHETSGRDLARALRTSVSIPAIHAFFDHPGPAERQAISAALQRSVGTGTNRYIELLTLDGKPLLAVPQSSALAAFHDSLKTEYARATVGPEFTAVGPLFRWRDTVYSPLIASVLRDSQPIAIVVLWRLAASTTRENRDRLARIIGGDARLYLGNASGDLWTDNAMQPVRFPVELPLNGTAVRYQGPGERTVITAAHRVDDTPWAVAIEMSDSAIVAPARAYLSRSIALGFLVLVGATVAAGLLSRRTTKPLHSLTQAARAVASGDYSRRVDIDRSDEIGILAESFNRMAEEVRRTKVDLEAKVAERTAQLSARNDDLEAFAHSVSHDLRAPLRAMHGFSQALLEDCSSSMDETAKDYARRIATASHRMDQLTQDLLAFSQVSRGEIALGPIDLDVVVRDALGQLEADISTKQARVDLMGPFPRVNAHRATLEQALANLVANGLKFVPAGQPPEITVRTERNNGTVRVWVEDNGIGIDPAHHKRIFAVFERLHQPDQYAGTGIGLAIVRKAVERMGGRVGVESAPGAGSRFWIELQSAEAA